MKELIIVLAVVVIAVLALQVKTITEERDRLRLEIASLTSKSAPTSVPTARSNWLQQRLQERPASLDKAISTRKYENR